MTFKYKLTLTHDERKAIDWIGNRYFHGDELYHLLMDSIKFYNTLENTWIDPITITYEIPEHLAWSIKDGIESENYELTCFNDKLKNKLLKFIYSII